MPSAKAVVAVPTDQGPRKVLRVVVERGSHRAPLLAQWGGISLKWRIDTILNDQPPTVWNIATDLLRRLLGDECELCSSNKASRRIT